MLFRRYASGFVLLLLTLVLTSGCVASPVTGASTGAGASGAPLVEVETAAPATAPTIAQPTATAPATATVEPTLAAISTVEATAEPTATVAATATVETVGAQTYRGQNPYRATPAFEVTYDPANWEYVEDDGSGRQSQLKHRTLTGCAIWLRAGPAAAKEMGQAFLAERAWTVAQVQPQAIQFVAPQDDIAFIFGVILNEDYTGMANSACQDAAEQVIDTFKIVAE